MSGIKYSEIALEREKKARQEALRTIEALADQFEAADRKIKALCREIPGEVIESFPDVHEMISPWNKVCVQGPDESMNIQQLGKLRDFMETTCARGNELLGRLIEIKERGRDARARELASRVELVRSRLEGSKGLLDKWRPREAQEQEKGLALLYARIEKGEFVTVQEQCAEHEAAISRLEAGASELEGQDRQRRYVMEALREVCGEMGWDEEAEPRLEDSADPESPYILTVETYSAGRMTFTLSLEGIQVEAPFETRGNTCYSQFEDFSAKLRKLGVNTKFRRIAGPDDPSEDQTAQELDEGYGEAVAGAY